MFDVFIYTFSLILSIFTFFAALYFIIFLSHTVSILPKGLRLYFLICYVPVVLLASIIRAIYAVVYLFVLTEDDEILMDIIESITPFFSQFVRHFFFSIVMERIIATVYLRTYSISSKLRLFWILAIQTFIASLFYGLFLCYNKFALFMLKPVKMLSYTTFAVHFITFIVFLILYTLNSKWYRASAYRMSLNKRHQMVENVKVLAYMFPMILIYTLISPLGSLIEIIGFYLKVTGIPYCVLHISNNLPHLLIFVRCYIIEAKRISNSKTTTVTTVKNIIGKDLPVTFDFDKYFKDLQQQWK